MTIFSIRPVSRRPSGLAESPLFLIGLAERLFVVDELFNFDDDDLRRCGMIRTIFNTETVLYRRTGLEGLVGGT